MEARDGVAKEMGQQEREKRRQECGGGYVTVEATCLGCFELLNVRSNSTSGKLLVVLEEVLWPWLDRNASRLHLQQTNRREHAGTSSKEHQHGGGKD